MFFQPLEKILSFGFVEGFDAIALVGAGEAVGWIVPSD
jgi:hypothetical protein